MQVLQELVSELGRFDRKTSLIFFNEEDSRAVSYRDLSADVHRLSRGLIDAGISEGDHIVVFSPNRYEWIVSALGVIHAGAVVVPVDAQTADETLAHILEDSGAKMILTVKENKDRLFDGTRPPCYFLDGNKGDPDSWHALLSDREAEKTQSSPDKNAVLFYTSGTTGPPKGVPLTHANIVFQLQAIKKAGIVKEDDKVFLPLPFHHVYPFVIGLLVPLSLGVPIVFPHSLTGPQIIRSIKEAEASVLVGVPRLYRALYDGIESRLSSRGRIASAAVKTLLFLSMLLRRRLNLRAGKTLLSVLHSQIGKNIRLAASGGSALSEDMHWKLEALGWKVSIGYGLTETSPILTLNNADGKHRIGSVGIPIDDVDIQLEEKSESEHGEVLAKGPGVFRGYRNLPDETKKSFTDNGWFKTGDLGYFDDDGFLFLKGRASTLIVTESGKNIQPDHLEDDYGEHPLIKEIGIFQKDNQLVAVVVPEASELRKTQKEPAEAIREAVSSVGKKHASYERINDYAVSRESLPRTRLGKIRRHLLPKCFDRAKAEKGGDSGEAAQPVSLGEMSDQDQALLENPSAKTLWDWLAKKYKDRRLTPDTSPQLDLDIDSLEWVNLTLSIREVTGIELTDEDIGRVEVIRDLLEIAAGRSSDGADIDREKIFKDPESMISDQQKKWLAPAGAVHKISARCLHAFVAFLMKTIFPLTVKGTENLPEKGPYIITPNHVSYLDPFAVGTALGYKRLRQTYWAGWTGVVFNNPVTRTFSRISQVVPIDPEHAAVSSLAFGMAVIKREKNLVWFPEGLRSPSGELVEFKQGLGILLKHLDVQVVPVIIEGAYEAWPSHNFFPRPHPITVTFGKPVNTKDLINETARKPVEGETDESDLIMRALRSRLKEMKKSKGK